MKFTGTIVALFAVSTLAQDLSGLPDCAVPCFEDSFDVSGCDDTTDFACLCASTAYVDAVETCVASACDTADSLTALEWAEATCDAAGVPLRR